LLARTIRDDFAAAGCFFNGEKRSASTGLCRNPSERDRLVSVAFAYKSLLIIADNTVTFPLCGPSLVPSLVSFGTGGRDERRRIPKGGDSVFQFTLRGRSLSAKGISLSYRVVMKCEPANFPNATRLRESLRLCWPVNMASPDVTPHLKRTGTAFNPRLNILIETCREDCEDFIKDANEIDLSIYSERDFMLSCKCDL
jgi:hypothetical protein